MFIRFESYRGEIYMRNLNYARVLHHVPQFSGMGFTEEQGQRVAEVLTEVYREATVSTLNRVRATIDQLEVIKNAEINRDPEGSA